MASTSEPRSGPSKLLIHMPGQKPVDFSLEMDRLPCSIGRSGSNCIVLNYPAVSRRHASLEFKSGAYWIEDLGSSNGTSVNGEFLSAPERLKPGDQIEIGPAQLHFEPLGEQRFDYAKETAGSLTVHSVSLDDILKADRIVTKQEAAVSTNAAFVHHLDRVTKALLANFSTMTELYNRVVELAVESLSPDRAVLLLREQDSDELVHAAAQDRAGSATSEIMVSHTIARQALENKTSIMVRDAMADTHFRIQDSVILQQIRSALCVPLYDDKEVLGLLYVDKRSPLQHFEETDLRLLSHIGNMAAIKIREVRALKKAQESIIMEEELKKAAGIQQRLLPAGTLRHDQFAAAGSNLPSLEVGGDYFDYWECEQGCLFVGLGDVSGKGMSAAILMSTLSANVRAYTEMGKDLADVSRRLNLSINRQMEGQRFITLFLARLDSATGKLQFVNAGHNPPVLVRANGELELLSTGGLLLGIFPEAGYDVGEVEMSPGDLLLIYSDGVTEAQHSDDEDDEYGTERLETYLKANASLDVEEIVDGVIDEAQRFSHPLPQGDDITVVAMRRL